jgi:tetratricopeptide (TPR) repeat protein
MAQRGKAESAGSSSYQAVYRQALRYGDLEVATNSIYHILAQEGNTSTWRDTLMQVYYLRGSFVQSLLLAEELLKERSNDPTLLAIHAGSNQQLGRLKEALASYERVYALRKDITDLYQVAALQYQLSRLGECTQSIQMITGSAEADKSMVTTFFDKQQQRVPVRAAALNLQGVMMLDLNKVTEAHAFFKQAIAAFPDFALAKANLAMVEKAASGSPPK